MCCQQSNELYFSEQFPHLDEGSVLKPLPIAVRQEIEYHSKFNALKQVLLSGITKYHI